MRFVVLISILTACGASPTSYCNRAASCSESNGVSVSEAELTQCVDLFEAIEEEFEVAGCGSEFKAALRCGLRNSTCEAGGLTLEEEDCEVDGEALETCEEER